MNYLEPARKPTTADWELGMTVCIAVKTDDRIFAVCDKMVSNVIISADKTAFKLRGLAQSWSTMFSTSADAGIIDPLTAKIRTRFRGTQIDTVDQACSATAEVYSEQLHEQINRTILARFNLTLGKPTLPVQAVDAIRAMMRPKAKPIPD